MATIWAVQCARARKLGFNDAALEGLDFVRARQLVLDESGFLLRNLILASILEIYGK